jgi:hypothetical protein
MRSWSFVRCFLTDAMTASKSSSVPTVLVSLAAADAPPLADMAPVVPKATAANRDRRLHGSGQRGEPERLRPRRSCTDRSDAAWQQRQQQQQATGRKQQASQQASSGCIWRAGANRSSGCSRTNFPESPSASWHTVGLLRRSWCGHEVSWEIPGVAYSPVYFRLKGR